ncbi:MAG TPA: hypothetical protein VNH11_22350 [Pirellulales bacterium]|nr:hypothetical protein [Pirellulales bacterium]
MASPCSTYRWYVAGIMSISMLMLNSARPTKNTPFDGSGKSANPFENVAPP